MGRPFVTASERWVPSHELPVVHPQTIHQLTWMFARTETSTCDSIIYIWPSGRHAMMTNFDPLGIQRSKHVHAHLLIFRAVLIKIYR